MLKGSSDICIGFSCQEQNTYMGTNTTHVTFLCEIITKNLTFWK